MAPEGAEVREVPLDEEVSSVVLTLEEELLLELVVELELTAELAAAGAESDDEDEEEDEPP